MAIRILVADDHTLFRVGMMQLLESTGKVSVVAQAATAESALAMIANTEADLMICDLTMPGATGTSLIEQIRQCKPALPVLVLSMHDESSTIRRTLLAGATGYVTKEASPETLIEAVFRVAHGERYIPPLLAEQLAFAPSSTSHNAHDSLSAREREVFRLIAHGTSLAQIGEQLHLSPKTITTHKTHLMEKLGIDNNADLIRYAVERRLFD